MNKCLRMALIPFVLVGCQEKYSALSTASDMPQKPVSNVTSQDTASESVVHTPTNITQSSIAPARRVDGRIHGQIISQIEVQAGELGMMPEDMTIYVVQVSVINSEHSLIKAGQNLKLYSKLKPSGEALWMKVATYSTQPSWIVGFE